MRHVKLLHVDLFAVDARHSDFNLCLRDVRNHHVLAPVDLNEGAVSAPELEHFAREFK